MTTLALRTRTRTWLTRWSPILPLLLAEATIWIGFGALLPVLPIYFTEHGTDLRMLGVVIAAWPAARLFTEPLFGWVADRAARKPLMVIGLFACAVATVLPLAIVGPLAFLVLRAVAGLATSIYDPAARGYLVDANPPEQQGETFGLYGAAQMGGLMLGPAVGGIAVALTRDATVGFWVAGIALFVAGVLVAIRIREPSREERAVHARERAALVEERAVLTGAIPPPTSLANKFLAAAVVMNLAWFFTSGAYEVVWSLYLTSIGGTIELVGLTFACFALPVLILGPIAGRFVDKRGGYVALLVGMGVATGCGPIYPVIPEVWFVALLGLVEGAAFALGSPALFALVARASPSGRSSTAQGIFGAAGTIGTIIASVSAGALAAIDLRYPYYVVGIAGLLGLAIGHLIAGRDLRTILQPTTIPEPPHLESPPFG
jgi:MFS transporter, DHA1 family, multidrug resistance protein